ncbi:MAG: sugar phosphate isomerase/epimerase [Opitutaceae bacterium]|jgi:sugar phosphate isomerase/epimerase|nr:sugar phosphate isomerase/epimerase [Opitutaceae bacterium]
MKKHPIALQMWSLRDAMLKDFAGTVAAVAQMGYDGVELAGYGNLDAAGAAAALKTAGLRASSLHTAMARLRGELPQVIDEAGLFATRHIICPYLPATDFSSPEACERIGGELNAIGARLRAAGLRLSYHNHAAEFAPPVGGRAAFDWFLDASEPRNLGAELDIYWAHVAGKNPVDFMREQGRRITLLHLKDEKELGLGPVDFDAVFRAIDSADGIEWLIVEQEHYTTTPLEGARACLEQLRRWGRA